MPQDLSLVVLNPSPDTRWTLPKPAHYEIKQAFFIEGIYEWRHSKVLDCTSITQAVLKG